MSEQEREDAQREQVGGSTDPSLEAEPSAGRTPTSQGERPKQFSLGVADFVETESFAEAEPERVSRRPGRVGAASVRGPSAGGSTARGAFGSGLGAGASAAGASAASASAVGELSLSPTRQRLLCEETHPQMVVVRVLEDAKWAQGRLRKEVLHAEGDTARLNSLKLFWAIRTEVVKVLQGLGVLPHELFFAEEESDFDHLPTGVVETIAGLLAGRLEPQPTADGDHAA